MSFTWGNPYCNALDLLCFILCNPLLLFKKKKNEDFMKLSYWLYYTAMKYSTKEIQRYLKTGCTTISLKIDL